MNFTPKEIVRQLDRYIIGQAEAKRSVAIALRNRYRRSMLDEKLKEEITPKNIIMIGPTGVGKTEIARRLAKLAHAPFVKVEATKFTEVGYVGRDVESIIRELVEASIRMVKNEKMESVKNKAAVAAEERLLDALLPPRKKKKTAPFALFQDSPEDHENEGASPDDPKEDRSQSTREKFRKMLRKVSWKIPWLKLKSKIIAFKDQGLLPVWEARK